jgi:hypothetical protein
MLRSVALVRTDVSEELSIPEDTIVHTHRRENLKSCMLLILFTFHFFIIIPHTA